MIFFTEYMCLNNIIVTVAMSFCPWFYCLCWPQARMQTLQKQSLFPIQHCGSIKQVAWQYRFSIAFCKRKEGRKEGVSTDGTLSSTYCSSSSPVWYVDCWYCDDSIFFNHSIYFSSMLPSWIKTAGQCLCVYMLLWTPKEEDKAKMPH